MYAEITYKAVPDSIQDNLNTTAKNLSNSILAVWLVYIIVVICICICLVTVGTSPVVYKLFIRHSHCNCYMPCSTLVLVL